MNLEVDPQTLQQKLASGNPPLLVDVRQPQELAVDGSIEGATLIPMNEIPARLGELPADREIVAYCKSGARSSNVANWLRQQGRNATSLRGGILGWRAAGLPTR